MNNPIVEKLKGQIQEYRTAEHFKEVLSCYYSGNLRSAVVMLYATVICDMIYKLERLSSEFNDTRAQQILNEVEAQWEQNPTSPDWETSLPKKCWEAHKILDAASHTNFEALQKLRHLCAHPAMKGNRELYQPSSEIVLGHIVNMLREILTRPALNSKDFIDVFLDDLATVKDQVVTIDNLNRYLKARYFDKYDDVALFYSLFKSLWKLVFYLPNEKCEENRNINYDALIIMGDEYAPQFIDRFDKDSSWFSNHIATDNDHLLRLFIKYVNIHIAFFEHLPEDGKIRITTSINSSEDLKALAIFLSSNPLDYIRKSSPQRGDTILYLSDYLHDNVSQAESLDFNIEQYGDSRSFDQADWRYDNLIGPYLKDFTLEQWKRILQYTNNNGQIYGRRKADLTYRAMKSVILAKDENFDFTPYRNFKAI